MNNHEIIISGSHMELTDALKQTVTEKLQRLFKFQEPIVRIRVELGYDHKKDSKEEFAAKGHVKIDGSGYRVPEDTEELVEEINKDVDKLVDRAHKKVLKAQFIAKGVIEIRGNDLRATESSEDLYKSLDKMVDKLERMLHERSDISKDKRKHGHKIDIPANIPKN